MMGLKDRTAETDLRVSSPREPQATAEAARLSPEGGFAAVPWSARMIELMELAAARLMRPHLRAGETSVSVSLDLTHVAKGAVNGPVRAVATCQGISGRLHRFTIHAFDQSGMIGSAEHTRAVVVERRLLALARRRVGKPSIPLEV
jgi:fluoroacetyl-CoA thioesterase